MSFTKRFKKAFTLTELVIAMIVIAAIVGVSVKITKAKLDSVISYTYYAAYNTLRSVSGEMIADDDGVAMNDDGRTRIALFVDNLTGKNKTNSIAQRGFVDKFLFLSANAQTIRPECAEGFESNCQPNRPACMECYNLVGSRCIKVPNYNQCMGIINRPVCNINQTEVNGVCVDKLCKIGESLVNGVCVKNPIVCIDGTVLVGDKCVPMCPSGQEFVNGKCESVQQTCEEGKEWDGVKCVPSTPSRPDPQCEENQVWDDARNLCVSKLPTLPQTGQEFCSNFGDKLNSVSSTSCSVSNSADVATAVSSSDFSGLTPDLVSRNGMKYYNIKNNPTAIPQLAGTDDLTSRGYIIYVDVDGDKGESILWEDVYPFYMTLSGRVVPAFRAGFESGGNSAAHLAVSVSYDTYPVSGVGAGGRKINWMNPKSTTFQNAACMSGYITAAGYCAGALAKQSICDNSDSDCQIIPVKPLKFF